MARNEACFNFWRYYLLLERDYIEAEKYVEPDLGDNYLYSVKQNEVVNLGNSKTYSLNFSKQLNIICVEFDSICRSVSNVILSKEANNMSDFSKNLLSIWPNLPQQEVVFYGKKLRPFEGWVSTDKNSTPKWWKAYTSCKHGRTKNFAEANLKNIINALAGLYTIECYFIKWLADKEAEDCSDKEDIYDVPDEPSYIFELRDFKTSYVVSGRNIYTMTDEAWLESLKKR